MISTFTSPSYVNRVKESWQPGYGVTQSGGAGSPTLYFDFLTGVLNPAITFTRASTATFFNSAGVLTSAANNAPRFDYSPSTLAAQGFLIEEQRTNSIRNNTMQGASAPSTLPTNWNTSYSTTLDGLTRGNSAAATVNGIASINVSLAGTATSTSNGRLVTMEPSGIGPIAALPGQTWTLSVYLTLVTGTMSGIQEFNIRLDFYDSAGTALTPALSSDVKSTITSTTSRPQFTATTPASTAFIRPSIQVSYANGAVIDFTIRIGLPQLELGAFATSVIPTTTTALTRAADVASVNTLSPWFNASAGTLYADFAGRVSGIQPYISMLSNTGETERIYQRYLGGQYQSVARVANVDIASVYNSTEGSAVNAKIATAYDSSQLATSTNGQAVTGLAVASLSSVPSGLNKLWLGSFAGTSAFSNGYLRRITYYPTRLSNAQLQAITA